MVTNSQFLVVVEYNAFFYSCMIFSSLGGSLASLLAIAIHARVAAVQTAVPCWRVETHYPCLSCVIVFTEDVKCVMNNNRLVVSAPSATETTDVSSLCSLNSSQDGEYVNLVDAPKSVTILITYTPPLFSSKRCVHHYCHNTTNTNFHTFCLWKS